MSFKSLFIASAISLFPVISAHAADVIAAPEAESVAGPLPTAFNWEGAYIGGQTGYSWAGSKFSSHIGPETVTLKPRGFLGGVYGGYNLDSGNNVIFGFDADATYDHQPKDDSTVNGVIGIESRLRWSGAVRARAGYAFERFLPYIAGGMAIGNIKDTVSLARLGSEAERHTRIGWTVGAGVDYAATDNVILRLEYRYADYGRRDYDFGGYLDLRNRFKTNEIRMGVAYKF